MPIYDTLGMQGVSFIVDQTEMEYVVATTDKAKTLIKDAKDIKRIKHIIIMDSENLNRALIDAGAAAGIELAKFDEIEALGAQHPAPEKRPTGDDIATICYTSGTTGNPKVRGVAVFPFSSAIH